MKSIKEISLDQVTKEKVYWNCSRPIEQELMYFLLIDRFHDGKDRVPISEESFKKGFGNEDALKVRCGGTIQGIIKHLEYISELGFTSIWINPFLQNSPESYHGYAIEDFLNVDEQWGTEDDIIMLVAKAHQLNMRIFFDVVLNHTANTWHYQSSNPVYNKGIHYTTTKWRYPEKPVPIELRDFNRYSRKGHIVHWDNVPETWDGDIFELKDLILDESFIGKQNLDLMTTIYSYWVAKTDCDGFRIDTAKHIRPEVLNTFIKQIRSFTESIGKKSFFIFTEIVGDQKNIDLYDAADGYLDFPFQFTFIENLLGKRTGEFSVSKSSKGLVPVRFLDNHDQIGQMPKQRIGYDLTNTAFQNVLKAFVLLPGIPCLYYGTEQGLQGNGYHDGMIRECMFDSLYQYDLMDTQSVFYSTIKKFITLRKQWKTEKGQITVCKVSFEKQETSEVVAILLENDLLIRLVIYNLGDKLQEVSIKLNSKITRNSNLIVYLYADDGNVRGALTCKNNEINMQVDAFGFYVLEFN